MIFSRGEEHLVKEGFLLKKPCTVSPSILQKLQKEPFYWQDFGSFIPSFHHGTNLSDIST
jgi:hypothetical protein